MPDKTVAIEVPNTIVDKILALKLPSISTVIHKKK